MGNRRFAWRYALPLRRHEPGPRDRHRAEINAGGDRTPGAPFRRQRSRHVIQINDVRGNTHDECLRGSYIPVPAVDQPAPRLKEGL